MRILLIEDDQKIASFILKGFKESGFAVDHVSNGEDGLHIGLAKCDILQLQWFHHERESLQVNNLIPQAQRGFLFF